MLCRNLLKEVGGLLDDAKVCADSGLVDIGKAETLKNGLHLLGNGVWAELADERRGEHAVNGGLAFYCHDGLEYLALVGYRTEGAGNKALTAGGAFGVIYLRTAMIVRADALHTAGLGTGTLLVDDRMERAGVCAFAAADALIVIDLGVAVYLADSASWAYLHARMLKAALTAVGDTHEVNRAAVAGKFDDIYKRRLIVLLGNYGILNTVGDGVILAELPRRQTHCKTQPFADDGSFEKQAVSVCADIVRITGTDLVCQLLERLGIVAALVVIGKACYLGKNRVSYSCFAGLHSSHAAVASCMKKLH